MKNSHKYWVIAFDDSEDGNAYPKHHITSPSLSQAFADALYMLYGYDHACIVNDEHFDTINGADFKQTAPYALIIEAGHHFNLH